MIAGVDSSGYHPTLSQVQAAYAQGVRVWGKYLPGPSIYSGDSKADFDTLKAGGMKTIAFCSGYADPNQQRSLGQQWGVDLLCLDVEAGIRGDGAWVQPWLNAAQAGLYGNPPVFAGRTAPFYVLAAYPAAGDPGATWPTSAPRPAGPCGWQWAGSVNAYGGSVDLSWFDDWFAAPAVIHPALKGGNMFALRSDGKTIDGFCVGKADGVLYTWTQDQDGTKTEAEHSINGDKAIKHVIGASWTKGDFGETLVVGVIGTNDYTYTTRFYQGSWSPFKPLGFDASF